jgi:hypothetical protein
MSSPHSNSQTTPVNLDDEGDICPICESECTCDNGKLSIVPQKRGLQPSLKVKVAASSSSNPKPSGSNKQIRSKPSTSASASAHLPQTGQFSISDPRLKSHLLDPTIPKRRGRPPKVVVAARAALAAAAAGSSPERIAGPSTSSQRPKANLLKKISKPTPKSKVRGSNAIKPPLARKKRKADDSYHPKGLVRRRPLVEDQEDSDDDDEEDKLLLEDDDDVEPSAPLDLPTFISASSSSSESSLSSLSSSEDSESEGMEVELEEEQNIKDSEDEKERRARKDKARVRRELLGENDPRQNGRSHHTSNRWDIKPRKRSVSASEGDVDMGTESGETTESDDEDQDAVVADDEDEPDAVEVDRDGRRKLGVSFAGVVTGWSDGEDSNYDADLFFANLDDSGSDSAPNPAVGVSSMGADGEDGNHDSGDEIVEAMTIVAAAGLYDGWEGPIIFATRDMDVEMDLSPSPKPSRRRRVSSSILTSDDERLCQQPTGSAVTGGADHFEDDNELGLAESDGETTEEELIGTDGRPNTRAMMLFKWPISVGAVDPMNTLTKRGNGLAPRPSTPQHEPEDFDDSSDKMADGITTPEGKKTRTPRTPRGPLAGTFQLTPQSADPVKTAVITGHQPALPSPYPRSRRLFSNGEGFGHHVRTECSRFYYPVLTNVTVDSEPFTIDLWPVLRANGGFECPQPIYGPRRLHYRINGPRRCPGGGVPCLRLFYLRCRTLFSCRTGG